MVDVMTATIMDTHHAMLAQILRYRLLRIHANVYGLMTFQTQTMSAFNYEILVIRHAK